MSCLLIMAGGTGGHVFPALAVAKHLQSQGVRIVWLGTRRGIESRLVPDAGYEIHWLSIHGLRGSGLRRRLTAPWVLLRAVWQAWRVLRQVKPDAVLGMGGFASGPGGVAAYLTRTPIVIHEQNAVAGMTNQWLAKLANAVLTGFRQTRGLPRGTVWVGNPVREAIAGIAGRAAAVAPKSVRNRRILILGGSQGARSLNEQLPALLAVLGKQLAIDIHHQTGEIDKPSVEQRYEDLPESCQVTVSAFIDDMAEAYQWADLIVCRAGAMTITEIMAAGRAAIFVPYPYAAGDHQTLNADVLVEADAALAIADDQLACGEFKQELLSLLRDPQRLQVMGEQARQLYRPQATHQVAQYCQEYLNA